MANDSQDLYTRIKPKSGSTSFYRAGFNHTLRWVLLTGLDQATVEALEGEQMLETSKEKPADFDTQEALAAAEDAANTLQPDPQTGLIGSSLLPVDISYEGGFEISHVDLVKAVFDATGLSVTGFNELPQDARDVMLQIYVDRLNADHLDAAALDTSVIDLTNQLNTANSNLTSMTADRDRLNGQVSTLTSQVSTLTSDKGGLQTQVTTLQGQVKKLEGELATAKAAPKAAAKTTAPKKAE